MVNTPLKQMLKTKASSKLEMAKSGTCSKE